MSGMEAWTASLSDREVAEAMEHFLSEGRDAPRWCFIEGPTVSEFATAPARATTALATLWLVRMFQPTRELAARRTGFDTERPWLVRWIDEHGGPSNLNTSARWNRHALTPAGTQSVVLYGSAGSDMRFKEGTQFRDPFDYPSVDWRERDEACLVVETCQVDSGPPIVRWREIRRNDQRPAGRE